jgi:sarcosine oxidase subunit alpha
MAQRPAFLDPDRPVLAGFRPVDRNQRLRAGAHFLGLNKPADIKFDEGYMTSVAYSPNLQHWIGLGLLKRGPERIGNIVRAYDPIRGADIEVEVCAPTFIDPEGVRLRG